MNTYPIILAHGIARFDSLRQMSWEFLNGLGIHIPSSFDSLHYFKGIASHLIARGFDVHHAAVSFASQVEIRAVELKEDVNRILTATGHLKAHLIAHSMGGLDARHMIVDHDMADKIATLTTIGTPHLGTPLADAALPAFGNALIDNLRPVIHLDGFADLMIERCHQFNLRAEALEAVNPVVYQAIASYEDRELIFRSLQDAWNFIQNSPQGGENDGLVPRTSQLWRKSLQAGINETKVIKQREFPFSADHLNQVGWFDPNQFRMKQSFILNPIAFIFNYEQKIRDFYADIAVELRQLQ